MKKILLLLLSISIIISSCKKEEESINSIIGVWKLWNFTTHYESGYIDPISEETIITETNNSTLVNEGVTVFSTPDTIIIWYYEIEESTIKQHEYINGALASSSTVEDKIQYQLINESTINMDGELLDISITNNELIITQDYNDTFLNNDTTEVISISEEMTLKKEASLPISNQRAINKKSKSRLKLFKNKKQ